MTGRQVCVVAAVVALMGAQSFADAGAEQAARGGTAAPARATAPQASHTTGTAVVGNVERGAYLAEHVAMCVECHSPRDSSGTILPSELFMGGLMPTGPAWATDWALRAPRNRGLPGYTEEQGIRLLTDGAIDRQGRQLRMPMPRFRMSRQDAADIVAFLKSLP